MDIHALTLQAQDVQATGLNVQISWLSGPPLAGRSGPFYSAPLQQRWDFPGVSQVHSGKRGQPTDPFTVVCSNYLRSYCREIIHGSQVRLPYKHYVCTDDNVFDLFRINVWNINLNEANLNAYGIELVTSHEDLSDNILNFEQLPSGKTPLRYTNWKTRERKILLESSRKSKLYSLPE